MLKRSKKDKEKRKSLVHDDNQKVLELRQNINSLLYKKFNISLLVVLVIILSKDTLKDGRSGPGGLK